MYPPPLYPFPLPRELLRHLSLKLRSPPPGYRRIRKSLITETRAIARRILPSRRRRRSLRLDELPVEVLEAIFAYACTDGGPTACSLSLVSKRIYAASRATHFTSVSLLVGSLDILSRFIELFSEAQRAAVEHGYHKPRVRHLNILLDPIFTCLDVNVWDRFSLTSTRRVLLRLMRKERESRTQTEWSAFISEVEEQYHGAVGRLLSLVAADLETLCLCPVKKFWRPDPEVPYQLLVSRPDLPKLRELWCGGNISIPPLTFTPFMNVTRRPVARYPALTRLHIFEPSQLDFWRWRELAPNVATLRITLCSRTFVRPSDTFLDGLQTSLILSDFQHWPLREPIHLMSPGPGTLLSDSDEICYNRHAARFRKAVQDAGSRVVFVPHYKSQDIARDRGVTYWDMQYAAGLARRDWLARISAGVAPETDGIYARDFWVRWHERYNCATRPSRRFMCHAYRIDRRVMPLVRW